MLLVLASGGATSGKVAEVKSVAKRCGLREMEKWNISQILADTRGLAVRIEGGWTLSAKGKQYLESKALLPSTTQPVKDVLVELRKHTATITNSDTRAFVEEAIGCLEAEYYRAGVVLSWMGAVAVLYDLVVQRHLTVFNIEARKTKPKWSDAKNTDDLARMGESDFLDVLDRMSILSKSVKQSLQGSLNLRNGCGHPNSFQIGQHQAAAHVETLVLHVFSVFR